jgi:DNA helicase-2/ATP-dependent DNA helicase PcrA
MAVDLSKLNKEQRRAVEHKGGPLLIVAGAGTGKTRVITCRIAHLIESKQVLPEEILALTFTDKAAGEMEDRVDDLLSLGYADLWISTFHSFCERVLRQNGLDIGIPGNFKLVDQTAAWLLVRKNMERFKLKYYKPLGNPTKFIHALLSHFSRCKDQAVSPKDYLRYAKGDVAEKEKAREIARAYQTYQNLLLENNLLDFGDLLNYTLNLFVNRPAVLARYQKRFAHILVDEFQDTNWIQYELVKLLAFPKNNLAVCADDDQAIYRWRGASFANILQFQKDFPECEIAALTRNYRSCQNILDLSHRFIQSNNPNRLECAAKIDKRLAAQTQCLGEIHHLHFKSADQETQGVVNEIIRIMKEDPAAKFSDFAVLLRANESAALFARACERSGVPAQFMALRGLYSKPAVLDIISYLKFLDNYNDSGAVWRVANMPFLMIPNSDIVKITQYGYKKSKPIYEAIGDPDLQNELTVHGKAGVAKLIEMAKKHGQAAREKNVSEIVLLFLEDSGYLEHLVRQNSRAEIDFIGQFYSKIKDFEAANINPCLKNFIDQLDMEIDSGEEGKLNFDPIKISDAVRIMTVHSAKGLEFDRVFIADLVDRKFPVVERGDDIPLPDSLAKDPPAKNGVHLEEERRLFYVAMTRARRAVYFVSAGDYGGVRPKKISRFLHEMGYNGDTCEAEVKTVRLPQNGCRPQVRGPLPGHFSFTQLATFEKCPMQYKFAHILRIPARGKAFFSYGKTMHNTLYDFLLELDGKKKGSLKMLGDIYKKNWIDEWYDSKDEKATYFRQGRDSLKNFWRDFSVRRPKILKINGVPALEKDFNLKINGCLITGKIDRIDEGGRGIEIIDYKTGAAKERLKPEDKMQLMIYQIAAEEVFGLSAEKLTYFYLNETKPLSFSPDEEEMKNQKEKIAGIIENIAKSDFRARPGWQCAWCEYKQMCEFAKKH